MVTGGLLFVEINSHSVFDRPLRKWKLKDCHPSPDMAIKTVNVVISGTSEPTPVPAVYQEHYTQNPHAPENVEVRLSTENLATTGNVGDNFSDWPDPENLLPGYVLTEADSQQIDRIVRYTKTLEDTIPAIQAEAERRRNAVAAGDTDRERLWNQFHHNVEEFKWQLKDYRNLVLSGASGGPKFKIKFKAQFDDFEKRLQKLETVPRLNPEWVLGMNNEVKYLTELSNGIPEVHETLRNDLKRLQERLETIDSIIQQPELAHNLAEGKKFGTILEGHEKGIKGNRKAIETVNAELAAIKIYNEETEDVLKGSHANQAKLLKQVEDSKRTQKIIAMGLAVVGMSTLGYLGWKGFRAIKDWYQNREKKRLENVSRKIPPQNMPEMSQAGFDNIRKRSHARDFKVEKGVYITARF